MSLQCDNLSGELQDQWSSSYLFFQRVDCFLFVCSDRVTFHKGVFAQEVTEYGDIKDMPRHIVTVMAENK